MAGARGVKRRRCSSVPAAGPKKMPFRRKGKRVESVELMLDTLTNPIAFWGEGHVSRGIIGAREE